MLKIKNNMLSISKQLKKCGNDRKEDKVCNMFNSSIILDGDMKETETKSDTCKGHSYDGTHAFTAFR